jgi:hypothetical protein
MKGQDNTEKAQELLRQFLPSAAQAWIDGLTACKAIWNPQSKAFEETDIPDHKVRAECAEKIWHNVVGRPIERSLQVTGNYKELSQVLEELRQSPEAMRLLPRELFESVAESGQSTAEGKESPLQPSPEQKTG